MAFSLSLSLSFSLSKYISLWFLLLSLSLLSPSLLFSFFVFLFLRLPFSLVLCASASVPLTHGFRKHQGICGVQTSLINHNLIIIVFVFLVVGGHGLVSRGCESGDPMAFSPAFAFDIHLTMFLFLLPLPLSLKGELIIMMLGLICVDSVTQILKLSILPVLIIMCSLLS